MKKFYKKLLTFLTIFVIIFNITIINTNAFNVILEKETKTHLFNINEFKLFYKIKYLKYIISEKLNIIKLQNLKEKTRNKVNVIYINENEFNDKLYGKNINIFLKIKINKILNNIFQEKNKIKRTEKMMKIYKKADNISKNTEYKKIKDAMDYLKIRIAINF